MLNNLIKFYDVILIDTTADTKYEKFTKIIMELSNINICLVEGNIIYVRKTMNLLKKYNGKNRKIKLIYNKKNEYTIKTFILKMIFAKFKFLGVLSYNNKYNKIINKNVNKFYITLDIKNEFKKIINKINKE